MVRRKRRSNKKKRHHTATCEQSGDDSFLVQCSCGARLEAFASLEADRFSRFKGLEAIKRCPAVALAYSRMPKALA